MVGTRQIDLPAKLNGLRKSRSDGMSVMTSIELLAKGMFFAGECAILDRANVCFDSAGYTIL